MNEDLKLSSYFYRLPDNLIADRPAPDRHNSKLLVYNQKDDSITHTTFKDLHQFLPTDSTLVMNNSKVFPCRLVANKTTGGKAEIFLLSLVKKSRGYLALVKSNGKKKIGMSFSIGEKYTATIVGKQEELFYLTFNQHIEKILEEFGKIPIPPYIRKGESDKQDLEDYQTVFAKNVGSVAAPTAGLHFTDQVFKNLDDKGVKRAEVTLHVGLGTFSPVKTESITDHNMHSEEYIVSSENFEKINKASKVFAVGTTSLRVLESSFHDGKFSIRPDHMYDTDIFLYPGVEVQSIDGLITNFHLPESTLLMLVSSIVGREKTLELYQTAIDNQYRFYSYGDAMLILRDR